MDTTGIVAIALGAVVLSMVLGLRRRVSHVERLMLNLQDRVTALEYPKRPPASEAPSTRIDIDPFVD